MGLSEPLAVVLLGLESLAPGQGLAVGLQLVVAGAAVLLPQWAFAARQPAESSAVVDAGLWPAVAVAVVVVAAAAGRNSALAAVESLPGTPQGTEQLLVAGLLDVLPETAESGPAAAAGKTCLPVAAVVVVAVVAAAVAA